MSSADREYRNPEGSLVKVYRRPYRTIVNVSISDPNIPHCDLVAEAADAIALIEAPEPWKAASIRRGDLVKPGTWDGGQNHVVVGKWVEVGFSPASQIEEAATL